MRPSLLHVILLSILVAGCIEPGLETGDPAKYELPGLYNTTIYFLNDSSVQVVENVINSTSVMINLGDSGSMAIRDPVAVDYSGNKVDFNVSREAIFGKTFMKFGFNTSFSGYVAFTQSNDGEFNRQVTRNGSIRVVLPVNFTTGSKFLGIALPEPDNISFDTSGREVLIWNDTYPKYNSISVKYYHK
ncbi:MAG: hypothetical protein J5U16_03485, partial [Candidatus Methanoperedens sp.]|nr:hypothetical protein [Candidatus Methanoperedens sp.]